jgi:hypothetical protein
MSAPFVGNGGVEIPLSSGSGRAPICAHATVTAAWLIAMAAARAARRAWLATHLVCCRARTTFLVVLHPMPAVSRHPGTRAMAHFSGYRI